jgi:sugar phosphate isomerase/epimerase
MSSNLGGAELKRTAKLTGRLEPPVGPRQPFEGTVDWPRLARILAESAYRKPVSMESNTRSYPEGVDEAAYLRKAFDAGTQLTEMIAVHRGPPS